MLTKSYSGSKKTPPGNLRQITRGDSPSLAPPHKGTLLNGLKGDITALG